MHVSPSLFVGDCTCPWTHPAEVKNKGASSVSFQFSLCSFLVYKTALLCELNILVSVLTTSPVRNIHGSPKTTDSQQQDIMSY
ncbi:hypothetical protein ILYODFUR_030422 [Ilyodon furcidens]|uniref:Uncharacterized protein n=2 Tax=Goodeidae TaxID=28758 RepID=A0ABU7ASL4_9TELE|nr:hypothetical protein [Ataeniobius toweri]